MGNLEKTLQKAVNERVKELMQLATLEGKKPTRDQLVNLLAMKNLGESAAAALDKFFNEFIGKMH